MKFYGSKRLIHSASRVVVRGRARLGFMDQASLIHKGLTKAKCLPALEKFYGSRVERVEMYGEARLMRVCGTLLYIDFDPSPLRGERGEFRLPLTPTPRAARETARANRRKTTRPVDEGATLPYRQLRC